MLESLITSILIAAVLPVVFAVFQFFRVREEKRQSGSSVGKIGLTKALIVFFAVFMILFFAGAVAAIVFAVLDPALTVSQFWIITGTVLVFCALGLVGYICAKSDYIILKQDEVLVKKPFRKIRVHRLSEIAFYRDVQSYAGGVTCYEDSGIPLFEVSYFHVGVERLTALLRERQVPKLSDRFPLEKFRENGAYLAYTKRRSRKILTGVLFGFGLSCLLLVLLISPQLKLYPFENVRKAGIIRTVERQEKELTLTLEGDEGIYRLNNIVYDVLDPACLGRLSEGVAVELTVGYVDELGRNHLSGIEIDGVVYLDPSEAAAAEASNYRLGRITILVFLVIGAGLLIGSLICLLLWKRSSR